MLVLEVRAGERIVVGDGDDAIVVRLVRVTGRRRGVVGIDAPKHVKILRGSLVDRVQAKERNDG